MRCLRNSGPLISRSVEEDVENEGDGILFSVGPHPGEYLFDHRPFEGFVLRFAFRGIGVLAPGARALAARRRFAESGEVSSIR